MSLTGHKRLYAGLFRVINRVYPWYRLPRWIGLFNAHAIRVRLRQYNLHPSEVPGPAGTPPAWQARFRSSPFQVPPPGDGVYLGDAVRGDRKDMEIVQSVLLRHYPELATAIHGLDNVFAPWPRVAQPLPPSRPNRDQRR
jgi:hypothetical protein